MKAAYRAKLGLGHLLAIGGVIAVVEAITKGGLVTRFTLPPLEEMVAGFSNLLTNPGVVPGGFFRHFTVTLYEIAVAYLLVCALGLPLGLVLGSKLYLREVWEPLILTFYAVPSVLFYPIIFFLLGLDVGSKIAMGALVGFLPLLVNAMNALAQVDKNILRMASSMGASTGQVWLKVVFPAAAPILITGLQLGLSYTLIGVVFAEVVASAQGLGFVVSWADTTLQVAELYAAIFIIVVLAVLVNLGFGAVEKRMRGRMKTV